MRTCRKSGFLVGMWNKNALFLLPYKKYELNSGYSSSSKRSNWGTSNTLMSAVMKGLLPTEGIPTKQSNFSDASPYSDSPKKTSWRVVTLLLKTIGCGSLPPLIKACCFSLYSSACLFTRNVSVATVPY